MFNFITIIILTGTSVAPVIFVYSIMAWLTDMNVEALTLAVVGLSLVGAALCLLRRARTSLETFNMSFTTLESADRENMGILVIYLAPLLETSFDMLDWTILVPLGALFLALTFTGNSFQFNPLLNILGWHFYKVGTPEGVAYVLITRRHIPNMRHSFKVSQMTPYTLG